MLSSPGSLSWCFGPGGLFQFYIFPAPFSYHIVIHKAGNERLHQSHREITAKEAGSEASKHQRPPWNTGSSTRARSKGNSYHTYSRQRHTETGRQRSLWGERGRQFMVTTERQATKPG